MRLNGFENKTTLYHACGRNSKQKTNIRWTLNDNYRDGYSNPFAELILIDGAAHIPHDYHATIAWEFFLHFKRNSDGMIVEN